MQTQILLATMVVFQLLWLAAIWWTGAVSNNKKLVSLLIYAIVAGVSVGWVLAGSLPQINQFVGPLLFNTQRSLILTLSAVTLGVGVIYAYYQRPWPFDEEDNFRAAKLVAEEGVAALFANYAEISWLGKQHPPLIPIISGFIMRIFGTRLFVMRLVMLILGLGTVIGTFFLGVQLYDQQTGLIAAWVLLTFPLFMRQSTAAMIDIPVTFCFTIALLMTLQLPDATAGYGLAGMIGIVVGIGLLSKYTMVFIYGVLFGLFSIIEAYQPFMLHLGVIFLVSISILAMWLVYAARIGVLVTQANKIAHYAGVKDKKVVLAGNYRIRFRLEALLSRLPSALGAYTIPLFFLGVFHLLWYGTPSDLFILLWIGIIACILIFLLPDHRYFLPTFPALAILMARGLHWLPEPAGQAVILALFYCGGALYLFVDWSRKKQLFIPQ